VIRHLNIKWKFMLIALGLSLIPPTLMGSVFYLMMAHHFQNSHRSELIAINQDWQCIAQTYAKQVQFLWERELKLGQNRLESMAMNLQNNFQFTVQDHPLLSPEQQVNNWITALTKINLSNNGNILIVDKQKNVLLTAQQIQANKPTIANILCDPQLIADFNGINERAQHLQYGQSFTVRQRWPSANGKLDDHLITVSYIQSVQLTVLCCQPAREYISHALLEDLQMQYLYQALENKRGDNTRIWAMNAKGKMLIPRDLLGQLPWINPFLSDVPALTKFYEQARQSPSGQTIVTNIDLPQVVGYQTRPHRIAYSYLPQWDWVIGVSTDMADQKRELSQILILLACLTMAISTISVSAAFVVARRIATPIEQLGEAARQVAWGSLSVDLSDLCDRHDEFGELATSFTEMALGLKSKINLLQLTQAQVQKRNNELQHEIAQRQKAQLQKDQLHEQLMATSREAGMAEIATAVLHNVGNVLNSINISASMLVERSEKTQLVHFFRIAELIREHQDNLPQFIQNDPQGMHLPNALIQLAQSVENDFSITKSEIEQLLHDVEHVKQIIHAQQSYVTNRTGVEQTVNPVLVIDDALAINEAGINQCQITIDKDYAQLPVVHMDKHKVLQILVNLISNAKHALDEFDGQRRLTLKLDLIQETDKNWLIYTGCGIAPEHLNSIFSHGYTTRVDGRGYGLHYSILTATEMGGNLIVRSPGIGQGATFTLRIPVTIDEAATVLI
jgi:C4-dicarboxylate-specific signal transduction histidine kinase